MDFFNVLIREQPLLAGGLAILLGTALIRWLPILSQISAGPPKKASIEWEENSEHVVTASIQNIEVGNAFPKQFRATGHCNTLAIDVYGAGIPRIAKMFLPLSSSNWRYVEARWHFENERQARLQLDFGANVSKQTVTRELNKLAEDNHPITLEVLEELHSTTSLATVSFTPKDLLNALEGKAKGELPPVDPTAIARAQKYRYQPNYNCTLGMIGTFLKYVYLPVAQVAASFCLFLKPTFMLNILPVLPGFGWLLSGSTIASVLPKLPTNLLMAYDLGMLQAALKAAIPGSEQAISALKAAGELLGREVTEMELDAVRGELVKILNHRSITQRVMGVFNFVNIMWLLAILGITISVGPFLFIALRPVWNMLMPLFRKIGNAVMQLVKNVVVPLANYLYELGALHLIGHILALSLLAMSYRVTEDSGLYVGISGILAVLGISYYSLQELSVGNNSLVHYLKDKHPRVSFVLKICGMLLPAMIMIPVAIAHQSTLIGYVVTSNLLAVLGFRVLAFPFCYCIGWDDDDTMARTCVACGLAVASLTGLRAWGVDAAMIRPFVSSVSVLGGIGHYLALLISSNAWHYRTWRKGGYWRTNVVMCGSLTASMFLGNILGMQGLTNTAITFTVLYVVDKVEEIRRNRRVSGWFATFGGSVGTYYLAMWLHGHPEFVVSMFRMME